MYRKIFVLLLAVAADNVFAETLECQIMREKILKQARGGDQCTDQWQICMRNAFDIYQKNSCDAARSGCQFGSALGSALTKDQLNEAIRAYKAQCE